MSARMASRGGLAFADAAVEVGTGLFVVAGSDASDGVQRVVCLAVASAGEAVADGLSGGGGLWCGAVAASERRFAVEALGVAGEELGGADRSKAWFVEERRVE